MTGPLWSDHQPPWPWHLSTPQDGHHAHLAECTGRPMPPIGLVKPGTRNREPGRVCCFNPVHDLMTSWTLNTASIFLRLFERGATFKRIHKFNSNSEPNPSVLATVITYSLPQKGRVVCQFSPMLDDFLLIDHDGLPEFTAFFTPYFSGGGDWDDHGTYRLLAQLRSAEPVYLSELNHLLR